MFDIPISKMNDKQLRNAVQMLYDELAVFKRKYNDAIYNLDSENLGKSFTVTQNNMKAQLKIAADAIKFAVTEEDLALELKNYSTIEQTAEAITSTVTAEYVNTLIGGGYVTNAMMMSQIQQSSEQILLSVSAEYETKADLEEKLKDYATITLTRDGISAYVQSQANLQNAVTITDLSQAIDVGKTYKIQSFNSSGTVIGETYYYYNSLSKSWEKISGDTVYTMFSQTDEGFVLKGNTIIDGNTTITRNLTLSGNVTWDMENSPVLTRYSSDGVSWHSPMVDGDMYMQMSFDGGHSWSTTTKVVGTDGKDGQDGQDGQDGWDGSDANVTARNVFNALTNGATAQGLFPAFYNGGDKLFINAEYIKSGIIDAEYISTDIAQVAGNLYIGSSSASGTKSIIFNSGASMGTVGDYLGSLSPTGLYFSGSSVKFTGLGDDSEDNEPMIYANGYLLATQNWVLANAGSGGGGTVVAVFG